MTYTDAEYARDQRLDMQADEDRDRRDLRAARDVDVEACKRAIRVLEEELGNDWFRGLKVIDFAPYELRLRDLERERGGA